VLADQHAAVAAAVAGVGPALAPAEAAPDGADAEIVGQALEDRPEQPGVGAELRDPEGEPVRAERDVHAGDDPGEGAAGPAPEGPGAHRHGPIAIRRHAEPEAAAEHGVQELGHRHLLVPGADRDPHPEALLQAAVDAGRRQLGRDRKAGAAQEPHAEDARFPVALLPPEDLFGCLAGPLHLERDAVPTSPGEDVGLPSARRPAKGRLPRLRPSSRGRAPPRSPRS
jgi:hypothetical protein